MVLDQDISNIIARCLAPDPYLTFSGEAADAVHDFYVELRQENERRHRASKHVRQSHVA